MFSRKKALLVGQKGKRKRPSEKQDIDDEEFDADMDDMDAPVQDDEDDDLSDDETAAEKRLRLGAHSGSRCASSRSSARIPPSLLHAQGERLSNASLIAPRTQCYHHVEAWPATVSQPACLSL